MPKSSLTVIIMTYNEKLHIERSIKSAQRVACEVVVIDSFSTDGTDEMARSLGAVIVQNPWINHATQLNWALKHVLIRTDWVMRLDADEYLDDELVLTLSKVLKAAATDLFGLEISRPTTFLGRRILHGGMMPMWLLRVWRKDVASCEQRWMDEHMVIPNGRIQRIAGNIVDDNLNHRSWWVDKHNRYASREAVDLLLMRHRGNSSVHSSQGLKGQASRKRWLKERVYARLPLGLRPWLYFFYRIVIRAGFLDGYRGLMFHTMQGLWYRLLVDAKVMEVEHTMQRDGIALHVAVQSVLDINLSAMSADRTAEIKVV